MDSIRLDHLLSVAARLKYSIPEEHKPDYQKLVGQLRDAAENVIKYDGEQLNFGSYYY